MASPKYVMPTSGGHTMSAAARPAEVEIEPRQFTPNSSKKQIRVQVIASDRTKHRFQMDADATLAQLHSHVSLYVC